jgi:hypothetical protein
MFFLIFLIELSCDYTLYFIDIQLAEEVALSESVICQYAIDAKDVQESVESIVSDTDLRMWMSMLQYYVSDSFRFSFRASSCAVRLMESALNIRFVIDAYGNIKENSFNVLYMQILLNGIDTSLSFEVFYDAKEPSRYRDGDEVLLNISKLLVSFCDMASDRDSLEWGNSKYESFTSRLTVWPFVLEDMAAGSHISIELNGLPMFIPNVAPGRFCMVSYSITAFASKMSSMLEMSTFTIIPGPFLNNTLDVAPGQFVIDIIASTYEPREYDAVNISCRRNQSALFPLQCSNYSNYFVLCPDLQEGEWKFSCPMNKTSDFKCENLTPLHLSNLSIPVVEICNVEFVGDNNLTCRCELFEDESHGKKNVVVQFGAVCYFSLMEFKAIWTVINSINADDLVKKYLLLVFIMIIVTGLYLTLWFVDNVDRHYIRLFAKTKRNYARKGYTLAEYLCKVDMLFPNMLQNDNSWNNFVNELKKFHRWVSLCVRQEDGIPRHLRFLFLMSTINCMLFFNTLLFNWVRPNSDLCESFLTVADCLHEPSILAFDESMCFWGYSEVKNGDIEPLSASCLYREATSHGQLTITLVTVSGLLGIPLLLVFEVLIRILCMPSSSIGDSENFANNDDIPAAKSVRNSFFGGKGVVPDVMLCHQVTVELRQLVYDISEYRKTLKRRFLDDFDAYWGFTPQDVTIFMDEVNSHLLLTPSCCDDEGMPEAKKRHFGGIISWLCPSMTMHPQFHCHKFNVLWKKLFSVRVQTNVELTFLSNTDISDEEKENKLFDLFKQDLIQGISPSNMGHLLVAHSTSPPTNFNIQHSHRISKGVKWIAGGFFILLNILLLLYIILFSFQDSSSGSQMQALVFSLALEIVAVSTLSFFISRLVVPFLGFSHFKEIRRLLRASVVNTMKATGSNVKNDTAVNFAEAENRNERVHPLYISNASFNCARYFFVSSRLVDIMPELDENNIIRHFRTIIPTAPYYHESTQFDRSRLLLRGSAFFHSLTLFIVYVVKSFMILVPNLEYYVISVMSWFLVALSDRESFSFLSTSTHLLLIFLFYLFVLQSCFSLLMNFKNFLEDASMKKKKHRVISKKSTIVPRDDDGQNFGDGNYVEVYSDIVSSIEDELELGGEGLVQSKIDYTEEEVATAFYYLESKGIDVQFGDDMEAHMATAQRMMAADTAAAERMNMSHLHKNDVQSENSVDYTEEEVATAFYYLESKGIDVQFGDDMEAHMATAQRMMAADTAAAERMNISYTL